MPEFKVHELYPTPVYDGHIDVKHEWLKFAMNCEYQRMSSNNGSYTNDFYILNKMPDLKKSIKEHFELYVRKYLKVKSNINFDFQNSWINKHTKGDKHMTILMLIVFLVGYIIYKSVLKWATYFLKFNLESNKITRYLLEYDEINHINGCEYKLQPKPGFLTFFPSHLVHSVEENLTDVDRYSLPFNLHFSESKWGDMESEVVFK